MNNTPTPPLISEIENKVKEFEERFFQPQELPNGDISHYPNLKGTALAEEFKSFLISALHSLYHQGREDMGRECLDALPKERKTDCSHRPSCQPHNEAWGWNDCLASSREAIKKLTSLEETK